MQFVCDLSAIPQPDDDSGWLFLKSEAPREQSERGEEQGEGGRRGRKGGDLDAPDQDETKKKIFPVVPLSGFRTVSTKKKEEKKERKKEEKKQKKNPQG